MLVIEVDAPPAKRPFHKKLRTALFLLVALPLMGILGAPIVFVRELMED